MLSIIKHLSTSPFLHEMNYHSQDKKKKRKREGKSVPKKDTIFHPK